MADLDGDQKSDLALAQVLEHERGYRISLRLSATGDSSYFDLPSGIRSGLTVRAQDVDGDHDLDLVITSGLSRQPVGIWLNDGVGNFTQGDASLYAEWIWRGPPILFSRSTSADRQSACPEESRSTLSLVTASVCQFGPVCRFRIQFTPEPLVSILPGPSRVRPPPAL